MLIQVTLQVRISINIGVFRVIRCPIINFYTCSSTCNRHMNYTRKASNCLGFRELNLPQKRAEQRYCTSVERTLIAFFINSDLVVDTFLFPTQMLHVVRCLASLDYNLPDMQVYGHKHEKMALKTSHTYDHSSDQNISVTIHHTNLKMFLQGAGYTIHQVDGISWKVLHYLLQQPHSICQPAYKCITRCQITYRKFLKVN